jgi:hypothetical protein
MEPAAAHLLLHGAIILTIGLLDGAPYGWAIGKKDEELIRAWKLAHLSLSLGGVTLIAVASAISQLGGSGWLHWGIAGSFISSGYGFTLAMNLEPFVRARGLTWKAGKAGNNAVYTGNLIGAIGSLSGSFLLIWTAAQTILA